jgi:hypothetical protein
MIKSIATTSNAPKWAAVRLLVSPQLGVDGTRMPSAAPRQRITARTDFAVVAGTYVGSPAWSPPL